MSSFTVPVASASKRPGPKLRIGPGIVVFSAMLTEPKPELRIPDEKAAAKALRFRRLSVWDRVVVRRWRRVVLPENLHRLLVLFVRVGDGWGWAAIAGVLYLAQPRPNFLFILRQALLAVAFSL